MPNIQVLPNQVISINTIYCIGRNYADHAKELNNPIPKQPLVFLKPNATIVSNGVIKYPANSSDVHHELELVILIGEKGLDIKEEDTLKYISAIGIGLDITARDIQQVAKQKGHPWTLAKGQTTFAPVSSFVPFKGEYELDNLEFVLEVNGQERQHGFTKDMLFSIPKLIGYISSFIELQPGDLIFTGTPSGVSAIQKSDIIKATLIEPEINLEVCVS